MISRRETLRLMGGAGVVTFVSAQDAQLFGMLGCRLPEAGEMSPLNDFLRPALFSPALAFPVC